MNILPIETIVGAPTAFDRIWADFILKIRENHYYLIYRRVKDMKRRKKPPATLAIEGYHWNEIRFILLSNDFDQVWSNFRRSLGFYFLNRYCYYSFIKRYHVYTGIHLFLSPSCAARLRLWAIEKADNFIFFLHEEPCFPRT